MFRYITELRDIDSDLVDPYVSMRKLASRLAQLRKQYQGTPKYFPSCKCRDREL